MYIETPIVKCIKSRIAAAKSIEHLTRIDLSGIKTTVIPHEAKELLEKCYNLYELNLTACGLESLDNLPNVNLTILLVGTNQLKDQQLDKLAIYQNSLEQLSLDKNNIQAVSNLAVFRSFSCLAELNLKENPLCQKYMSYSNKIFEEILNKNEQLTLVDRFMRNGEILSDEDGKDYEFDGPGWLIDEEESSNKSGNQGSIEQRKSISSDQNGAQRIDSNMISLYQQYQYNDPSCMVKLLNEHEMGLMKDPNENCFEDELEENGMDIEEQVEAEGSKCAVTKKIKCDEMIEDEYEY